MQPDPALAARRYVLDEHGALVDGVAECADRVAAAWEGPPTERAGVVEPFSAVLADAGLLERLPDVLAGAVDAAGYDLRASPVAAPPYVTVTSTGPVCRATVADERLVLRFDHFRVERAATDGDRGTRYVRRDCDPTEAVSVALRE
ncbi:hypothetical protein [Haloarchaeobius sp. HRN-SO-5]|uniref:hypothetical protein n=1 Tax=Haloarchaeobius sp. HRN-SO-5 TaxID=3446118 RepID=UPI003EB704EB